uniref:Undecaprenyl-diphosphatase n=1 Tax=Anisakis simplex TaxID=6269 RepID=A0A0M3JMQ7_ANISI
LAGWLFGRWLIDLRIRLFASGYCSLVGFF